MINSSILTFPSMILIHRSNFVIYNRIYIQFLVYCPIHLKPLYTTQYKRAIQTETLFKTKHKSQRNWTKNKGVPLDFGLGNGNGSCHMSNLNCQNKDKNSSFISWNKCWGRRGVNRSSKVVVKIFLLLNSFNYQKHDQHFIPN